MSDHISSPFDTTVSPSAPPLTISCYATVSTSVCLYVCRKDTSQPAGTWLVHCYAECCEVWWKLPERPHSDATSCYIHLHTDTYTYIHTYRQTDRQTDRQTCIHSDIERQRFQSIQLVVAQTLGTCRSVSLTAQWCCTQLCRQTDVQTYRNTNRQSVIQTQRQTVCLITHQSCRVLRHMTSHSAALHGRTHAPSQSHHDCTSRYLC